MIKLWILVPSKWLWVGISWIAISSFSWNGYSWDACSWGTYSCFFKKGHSWAACSHLDVWIHIKMWVSCSKDTYHRYWTSRWQTRGCVCRNFCFETKKCPHVFLLPLWIVLGKILMKKYSEMIQNCANDHKSCLWVQINSVFLLKTSF